MPDLGATGRRRTVPPSSYIPAAEALYQFPSLKTVDSKGDALKGCLVIYDGQQNDTRMNVAIALTAVRRPMPFCLSLLMKGHLAKPRSCQSCSLAPSPPLSRVGHIQNERTPAIDCLLLCGTFQAPIPHSTPQAHAPILFPLLLLIRPWLPSLCKSPSFG